MINIKMGNIMTNQHANSDHSPERAEENKKKG